MKSLFSSAQFYDFVGRTAILNPAPIDLPLNGTPILAFSMIANDNLFLAGRFVLGDTSFYCT